MSPLTSLYYSYTSRRREVLRTCNTYTAPASFSRPATGSACRHKPEFSGNGLRHSCTLSALFVFFPRTHGPTCFHRFAAVASFSAYASAQTRDTLLPRTYTCFFQATSDTPPSLPSTPPPASCLAYSCTPPALSHSLRIYSYLVLLFHSLSPQFLCYFNLFL